MPESPLLPSAPIVTQAGNPLTNSAYSNHVPGAPRNPA
jgi:hypothetical protein